MNLPEGARCLFDATEVDRAIDQLAVRMAVALWDANPILVCLMNGGLPFTADLMRRFYFPLELDHVRAARYRGTAGGELRIECWPGRPLEGRTVVLLDDVFDEGITLQRVRERLADAGPERVLCAVMVRKDVPGVTFEPDYIALEAPNEFIVGRGMDCDGAYRQLSGIYALPS